VVGCAIGDPNWLTRLLVIFKKSKIGNVPKVRNIATITAGINIPPCVRTVIRVDSEFVAIAYSGANQHIPCPKIAGEFDDSLNINSVVRYFHLLKTKQGSWSWSVRLLLARFCIKARIDLSRWRQ
jgi:hypothetical protein